MCWSNKMFSSISCEVWSTDCLSGDMYSQKPDMYAGTPPPNAVSASRLHTL